MKIITRKKEEEDDKEKEELRLELLRMYILSGLINAFEKKGLRHKIKEFCYTNPDKIKRLFKECLEECPENRLEKKLGEIEWIATGIVTELLESRHWIIRDD